MRGRRPRDGGPPLNLPWWAGPDTLAPAAPGAPWDIVFLDRDGTLNERVIGGYVTDPAGLRLIPGAVSGVRGLAATGSRLVLVTNQRAVARGLLDRAGIDAVHTALSDALGPGVLDAIVVCPHETGTCGCRKPLPGMFTATLERAPWARASRCLMIGDMPSDLEPAEALGMAVLAVGPERPLGGAVQRLLGRLAPPRPSDEIGDDPPGAPRASNAPLP